MDIWGRGVLMRGRGKVSLVVGDFGWCTKNEVTC